MRPEENPFDPDTMHVPSAREGRDAFVPIEEVPDRGLDPREALMRKEEGESREKKSPEKEPDSTDLSRSPAYLRKEFTETVPASSSVGPDRSATGEAIADAIEQARLRETKSMPYGREDGLESHGKRGRKPEYKDRRISPKA